MQNLTVAIHLPLCVPSLRAPRGPETHSSFLFNAADTLFHTTELQVSDFVFVHLLIGRIQRFPVICRSGFRSYQCRQCLAVSLETRNNFHSVLASSCLRGSTSGAFTRDVWLRPPLFSLYNTFIYLKKKTTTQHCYLHFHLRA